MKKVTVYLFSGTGNTKKVTTRFAAELQKYDVDVAVYEIDKDKFELDEASDAICIAYPIHAFNAPQNVLRFAESLPNDSKKAFFIKTGGEPLKLNDASSARLAKILTEKGYRLSGEYHYVMPYNMLYRHADSMAGKMWFTAERKIVRDVQKLLCGMAYKGKKDTVLSLLCRLVEQPFMRFNGRFYRVNGNCDGCLACVKSCPQKNIVVRDGKITFGKDCIGCVRCSFNCHRNAIDIGFLNCMKVNGRYRYPDYEPSTYECKHLKRTYKRYFANNI